MSSFTLELVDGHVCVWWFHGLDYNPVHCFDTLPFAASQQAQGHHRRPQRSKGHDGPTPLFDDTSSMGPGQPGPGGGFQGQGSYGPPQQQQQQGVMFPGQQLMNDPMANMAMQYGASLADHGKDVVEKQVWYPLSLAREDAICLPRRIQFCSVCQGF